MSNWPMSELKDAIKYAHDWLEDALAIATEDPEACANWPALDETARRISAALESVRALLPLHPEIEAAVKGERDEMDEYESPEAMGLRP
jgi:hypothetical protein